MLLPSGCSEPNVLSAGTETCDSSSFEQGFAGVAPEDGMDTPPRGFRRSKSGLVSDTESRREYSANGIEMAYIIPCC